MRKSIAKKHFSERDVNWKKHCNHSVFHNVMTCGPDMLNGMQLLDGKSASHDCKTPTLAAVKSRNRQTHHSNKILYNLCRCLSRLTTALLKAQVKSGCMEQSLENAVGACELFSSGVFHWVGGATYSIQWACARRLLLIDEDNIGIGFVLQLRLH